MSAGGQQPVRQAARHAAGRSRAIRRWSSSKPGIVWWTRRARWWRTVAPVVAVRVVAALVAPVSPAGEHRHHPGHGRSSGRRGRPKTSPDDLKKKVAAVHRSAKAKAKLETAKKELLELLSPDQEAVLVGLGYID